MTTRWVIYAHVTEAEHAMIKALAKAENVSIAEWMRRAVNRQLFERDEDSELLTERGEGMVRGGEKCLKRRGW